MEAARANGQPVIKIGRKGKRKFQFGDDGPVFEVDVTRVYSELAKMQEDFITDVNGQRLITKTDEWNSCLVNYVSLLHGSDQQITLTEAREFWAVIQEEAATLATFFDLELRRKSSSQGPSAEFHVSDSQHGSETFSGSRLKEQPPGTYSTVLEVMPPEN